MFKLPFFGARIGRVSRSEQRRARAADTAALIAMEAQSAVSAVTRWTPKVGPSRSLAALYRRGVLTQAEVCRGRRFTNGKARRRAASKVARRQRRVNRGARS